MAYDKVVDSSALDAGLKQIADAIREKSESSDSLAFPEGFVEAIEAGGGGLVTIKQGTFIPANVMTSIQIADLIGKVPDDTKGWFFYVTLYKRLGSTKPLLTALDIHRINTEYPEQYGGGFSGAYQYDGTSLTRTDCTYTDGEITALHSGSSYKFGINCTYVWIYGECS